ncbi:MAG: efflux RND transporter permease subunit, partial [Luteimonas sp.]|nr:efflux RND transporter permease subunit [Luteimonas sp.]
IKRPVFATVLSLLVLLIGLMSFSRLTVREYPNIDEPVVTVDTTYTGASAEIVESQVTKPLEDSLAGIEGVDVLSSISRQERSQITVRFRIERSADSAAADVRDRVSRVRQRLPDDIDEPVIAKVEADANPIIWVAFSSDRHTPLEISDFASRIVKPRMQTLPGAADARLYGERRYSMRIWLDRDRLAAFGLTAQDVEDAIRRQNVELPAGRIESEKREFAVVARTDLAEPAAFEAVVVRQPATPDGYPVRIRDIGRVEVAAQNERTAARFMGKPAVSIGLIKQSTANPLDVKRALDDMMPRLQAELPEGMRMAIANDTTVFIDRSIAAVFSTIWEAVLLVAVVCLFFLRNWRAMLVPLVTIPVSLVGAFTLMLVFGFSINTLTLLALVLAIGLVVDDAIVVLENISRHVDAGLSPWNAAMRGAGEVGTTLLSMNIALGVVFVSILFLDDFVERLFREFSLTLVAAMTVSLLVSLSLTPTLCARLLGGRRTADAPTWQRLGTHLSDSLRGLYLRTLGGTLRHTTLALLILLGAIVFNAFLFAKVPKGTVPEQDTGQLRGFARGDDGLSFQVMQPKIQAYREYLLSDPAIADISGYIGGGTGVNNGFIMIQMKPLAERGVSSREVIDRLRAGLPKVPGGNLWLWVDQDIRIGGGGGSGEGNYDLRLLAGDIAPLREWTPRIREALEALPQLVDVDSGGDEGMRQVSLEIDRSAAAQLGVDMRTVATVLNNSFSQRQVATLYDSLNQYRVVMELDPRHTQTPDTLDQVFAIGRDGQRVPLSAFARWDYGMAPDRIQHREQFLSTRISFALAPEVTLGEAVEAIDQAMARIMLPNEVQARLGEEAGSLQEMRDRQAWMILGAVLAVYLVLGVLYESYLQPLAILSILPSAGVGALLALLAFGGELNLISLLGLFLLVGVVMKNTILMVDFALAAQREQGLSPEAAILDAAKLRFRPILMTSLAALLGMLPLVLSGGEGWEMRRPLGLAIVGGLLVSQVLTLYTTPAAFLVLARVRQWFARRMKATPQVVAKGH